MGFISMGIKAGYSLGKGAAAGIKMKTVKYVVPKVIGQKAHLIGYEMVKKKIVLTKFEVAVIPKSMVVSYAKLPFILKVTALTGHIGAKTMIIGAKIGAGLLGAGVLEHIIDHADPLPIDPHSHMPTIDWGK